MKSEEAKPIPRSRVSASPLAAKRRDLVGRTITAVEGEAHWDDTRKRWIHQPTLTLDDGRAVWFVTEESDIGEYGTEICISPKPKPPPHKAKP